MNRFQRRRKRLSMAVYLAVIAVVGVIASTGALEHPR